MVTLASEKDPLTGIANRRKFDLFANEHWTINLRDSTPISIIMIDIDLFKKINDTCGHTFGDQCLVKVANVPEQACDDQPICVRGMAVRSSLCSWEIPRTKVQEKSLSGSSLIFVT